MNISLDLGGTLIKIGIVDNGKVIASKVIPTLPEQGFLSRIDAVVSAVNDLLKDIKIISKVLDGVGVSVPGIVDTHGMKLISVNKKYTDLVGFNFINWAQETWGLPIVVENDARAALVGEWKYGAGKGVDSLAMVTLGTGIGGAVVIEGKLLHGKHFQAGCLPGHFIINYEGVACTCGNIGCAESEASSWRLPELAKQDPRFSNSQLKKSPVIDYKEVFDLSAQDELAEDLVIKSLNAWSACVINIIHAYDPEMVIIGGGIMKSADRIIPFIRAKVEKYAWTPWGKVKIVPAQDMDLAALLGVGYLMKNRPKN